MAFACAKPSRKAQSELLQSSYSHHHSLTCLSNSHREPDHALSARDIVTRDKSQIKLEHFNSQIEGRKNKEGDKEGKNKKKKKNERKKE